MTKRISLNLAKILFSEIKKNKLDPKSIIEDLMIISSFIKKIKFLSIVGDVDSICSKINCKKNKIEEIYHFIIYNIGNVHAVNEVLLNLKKCLSLENLYKEFFIEVAPDINKEKEKLIEDNLKKKTQDFIFVYKKNDSLLRGFTIREGQRVLDLSCRNKINVLKSQLYKLK